MTLKRFDGSSNVDLADISRWDGSSWVALTHLRRWDGASWVDITLPSGPPSTLTASVDTDLASAILHDPSWIGLTDSELWVQVNVTGTGTVSSVAGGTLGAFEVLPVGV